MRDPKHIAFFVSSLNIGGVESVFLTYSDVLSERGYKVDFVVAKAQGALLSKLSPKVNLIDLGGFRVRKSMLSLRKYIKDSTVSTVIAGPDIVNFISILVNLSISHKNRINLIVSQHSVMDNDAKTLGLIGRLIPFGKRILYRFASSVIAVSNAVSDDLIKCGVPSSKVYTVYNPINIQKMECAANQELGLDLPHRYIVFVGRLYEVKNVGLLIRALNEINDNSLHLVIVGDGDKYEEWKQLSIDMSVSHRVHFTGALSNPAPLIKGAEVVAVPSFSEAFPMVVIESAALGRTIAHTPNLGCMEILGSEYGYCSKSFVDPTDYAITLKHALENPIEPQKMKRLVEKLDENVIIPKLEILINK